MASFQSKMVWKWSRKRENKYYRFVPFFPDALYKIPKKQEKNYKSKKNTIMASLEAKID